MTSSNGNIFRVTGPLCGEFTGHRWILRTMTSVVAGDHDDVIKWKHFPRYWPFVRRIHRSPVNSPHNDQCRGALIYSLTHAWINVWVNNREAGDLRPHRAHYDVIVIHIRYWRPVSTRKPKHDPLMEARDSFWLIFHSSFPVAWYYLIRSRLFKSILWIGLLRTFC